jgi:hypothetical protein
MKFWRGIGNGGIRLSDGYVSTARPESVDRMRAIRSEQPSEALPAIVAGSYFDSGGAPVYFGILKRWTGSAWAKAKLKVYAGTWVEKPLKRWTGSAWVTVDTTGV